MKKTTRFLLISALVLFIGFAAGTNLYALSAQSAAVPGETLTNQSDESTPVLMKGVFAVELTGTGVGTVTIYRSESGTGNWVIVKTFVIAAATTTRKFLYENFGDTDRSAGAYYKAIWTAKTSGSAGQVFEAEPLLTDYYQARGWDVKTGIPTKAKLNELGLGFTIGK